MKIIQEFQEFIARGNVIDLAVGVIIGGAFGKIVTSLVNDVIMPPIGYLMHGINFADLYISLNGNTTMMVTGNGTVLGNLTAGGNTTMLGNTTLVAKPMSYDAAKLAGDAVIGYGAFFNTLLEFFIVAVCVFMLVKGVNQIKRKFIEDPPPAPPTKTEELLGEIRDLLRKG